MPRVKIVKKPPADKAREIISTIDRLCARSTFAYPLVIEDGEGCYLKDIDGNVYLDFTSNICSCPLGYAHNAIIEALKEYSSIGVNKIAGQDFYCKEHAEIAYKLSRIIPNNFKAFFVNSGAEAVENAIKLAYRYTGKSKGISFYGAFHGRTLGALTFTYSKEVQKKNYPELPVKRLRFATRDNDPSIDMLDEQLNDDSVAFIIVEVIQGEGGYRVASRRFLSKVYRLAKQYNIPLIIDEVQSGLARTGKWWAFEHYDIKPDIMSIAKGLQVGAAVYDQRFDPEEGAISSTWGGGDRIDMAIGARIIEVIEKEHLMDNARAKGELLLNRLNELKQRFDSIEEVRGLGLMIGLEFKDRYVRDKVLLEAFKNGLLLLQGGSKALRIAPPLIISDEEIDEGLEILEKVLKIIS